jgi:hypothetical protein
MGEIRGFHQVFPITSRKGPLTVYLEKRRGVEPLRKSYGTENLKR